MIIKNILIKIHNASKPRAISSLSQQASKFESDILMKEKTKQIDLKNMEQLMQHTPAIGKKVTLTFIGTDEAIACEEIVRYFNCL